MADHWRVESPDLVRYIAVIDEGARSAVKEVRQVVSRGGLNIKRDAAKAISGLAHAPAYPRSITYDLSQTGDEIAADIGPDKQRRQGALGNVLEYGTLKNPPHPHMLPAADRELPKFGKALEVLAARLLGDQ